MDSHNNTGAAEHRCGFDELQRETINTRVSLVNGDDDRSVETASSAWQPIRIVIVTADVDDNRRHCTSPWQLRPNFKGNNVVCQSEDVLTNAKRQTLLEFLVPSAVQLHQERLSVQRSDSNIVVSAAIDRDPLCRQFSIPAPHRTTGVPNADFVLYLSAGPTVGNLIAWALPCQHFRNGRPSVGVANVSPKFIAADPRMVRLVAHEILHALGFNIQNFRAQRTATDVVPVRGKRSIPVIRSPSVVARARAQYGCGSLHFMELEDMGGEGTELSHWKRRNAEDELMAGISGAGVYSALSIAAMEDLGYYRGNCAMAEPMAYGRNAGCGLTTGRCVVNGVSQFPEMFCAFSSTAPSCASDRLGVGYCAVRSYATAVPELFRYFANPTVSGEHDQMDYCPYVQEAQGGSCVANGGRLPGSVFGFMSRCLDAPSGVAVGGQSSGQYGICAEVQCASSTYAVRVRGASRFTSCTPGASLTLSSLSSIFSGGHITCPSYISVCGLRVKPSSPAGGGGFPSGDGAACGSAGMAAALVAAAAMLALLPRCWRCL
ncbi:major surface protease gp63 [Novymonas esmeraldas]|uniref:Leishmanolysin-like peptidase n=1 Tax=Novymonas esmeraldas TaxID=1808958 RepID=A0AAW0ES84_9TRYP